ncbi:pyrroline-5-carboxylate reductase [Clostridia bacterium]|nr:pyrroline-5-carboxylate reductase [Clostridia bacterium]
MTNVGFLGVGNMGKAIINGIAKSKLENIELTAFDINKEQINSIKNITITVCEDENELVLGAKYLFLCVKPQIMKDVLKKISTHIRPDTVIISIAAGISGEHIQDEIQQYKSSASLISSLVLPKVKVIQVMPNTPLMLGEGAVALAKFEPTTDDELKFVEKIFSASGKTAILPKEKMNEIIAINGSSPAFIYLFAKAFIEYATENGLDSLTCKQLFAQTLIGSAKMLTDSGFSIDELIKQVSSPGGTTLAGLERLYEGNLVGVTKNACTSCLKRAIELGGR